MTRRWAAPLLCLLGLGVAHADEAPMFAERPGTHGFLYEVRARGAADHRMFLYGTIHVGSASQTPFTRPVRAALAKSQQLALEADVSNLGSMVGAAATHLLYARGDSLDRHVPAETIEALRRVLPRLRLDEAQLLRTRLWAVPMMLGMAEAERLGLSGSFGADVYLAAYAKTHGLPIVEVEGAEAQLAMLSSAPPDLQLEALRDALVEVESGDAKKKLERVVRTWEDADTRGAEAIVRESHASKKRSERDFARRLLDDRNLTMLDRAEALLRGGETTFVAVGTAHLFGERGLIALLRKRGHSVTPIRQAGSF